MGRLKGVQAVVRALFKASLGSFDRLFWHILGQGLNSGPWPLHRPKKRQKNRKNFVDTFRPRVAHKVSWWHLYGGQDR
jgi:hypothetical protein